MAIASNVAPVFAALGDGCRLEILALLGDGGDHPISEIAHTFPITRQGVTRHLRVLEQAGLVRRKSVGREVRYRLEKAQLETAKQYLIRASTQWDEAIERLASQVQTP